MIKIGSIELQHPMFLSAGCAKDPADARPLLDTPTSALVVGSITTQAFNGDDGDMLWCDGARSVTGFGFPSASMDQWQGQLPAIAGAARHAGKPLVVSVSGTDVADYLQLAERAFACGANVVEMNLFWPCLLSPRQVKHSFSDDPEMVVKLLNEAATRFKGKRADLWLKFSPLQPTILERVANAIASSGAPVTAVVCSGPYPKTLFLDTDNGSVLGTQSFGQMGGEVLRPIALGQVRQFRNLLPSSVAVIGTGGISIREHVDQFLAMGASAVGLVTAYKIGGADIFSYLFPEMAAA